MNTEDDEKDYLVVNTDDEKDEPDRRKVFKVNPLDSSDEQPEE